MREHKDLRALCRGGLSAIFALAAFPACGAEGIDRDVIANPPPSARLLVASGVDYEATMVVSEGKKPDQRISIVRSGPWQIERSLDSPDQSVTYSNFDTGTSIVITRNSDGSYRSLSISRSPSDGSGHDVHRTKTDQTDSVLGENCTVWRSTRGSATGYLDCVTTDGIDLWTRVELTSGYVWRSARVTKLVRRDISPEEVQFPGEVLDWSTWYQSPPQTVSEPAGARNYEVQLQEHFQRAGEDRLTTIVHRRRGGEEFSEHRGWRGARVNFTSAILSLSYTEGPDGRADHLGIRRRDALSTGDNTARLENLTRRTDRTETVLGENCTWFDIAPGMADGSNWECRTIDGIAVVLDHSGSRPRTVAISRAISIRREQVTERDMVPPPKLFDWATWGVRRPAR
ncbi:MAG TPA: hypothetical protein VHA77_16495 [Xanthobacteraceae bacterium]|jgi:hypothetical protein|nr:hypothetical protein [Xanthobacteraceae bacterium]